MIEERDVVIVGGGIAGMTAARELRDCDPLILEASERVGGRVWSKQRGDLALSVGAHMFPPPDSVIGRQVDEFGLEVLPITGSMLNIAMNDRIVAGARPEAFPFKLALSLRGRVAFARAGLKVRKAVAEHEAAVARRPGDTEATIRLRSMQAGGDTSFGDYLGPLHPEAERIFQALCNRSSGDLNSITQASMATLFAHVWDSGDLGRNMRGGSGLLPEALGRDLAAHIRLHTAATRVTFTSSGVDIDYVGPDGAGTVRARTVILAIPAPFIPALLGDALPSDTATALDRVTIGPTTVLSILTDETEPMPWDDVYSLLTPDCRFNMFFNHSNALHATGAPKQGSLLMVYGGGGRARALAGMSEAEMERAFLDDLHRLYPQTRGHIAETWLMPWQYAVPHATPGRWRVQETLERGIAGRVFLAGDWVGEFGAMETAALTGVDAAASVRSVLDAGANA